MVIKPAYTEFMGLVNERKASSHLLNKGLADIYLLAKVFTIGLAVGTLTVDYLNQLLSSIRLFVRNRVSDEEQREELDNNLDRLKHNFQHEPFNSQSFLDKELLREYDELNVKNVLGDW